MGCCLTDLSIARYLRKEVEIGSISERMRIALLRSFAGIRIPKLPKGDFSYLVGVVPEDFDARKIRHEIFFEKGTERFSSLNILDLEIATNSVIGQAFSEEEKEKMGLISARVLEILMAENKK